MRGDKPGTTIPRSVLVGYDLIVSRRPTPFSRKGSLKTTVLRCVHVPPELHRTTSRNRKFGAVVQAAHFIAVESLLLDFEVGAQEQLWRQFFDCKPERVCGSVKSSVSSELTIEFSASRWK